MYNDIVEKIKEYDTIVIARHIGVDPDAMSSQIALRDAIKLTYPEKNVYAVGNGSGKFSFIGRLDHYDYVDNALLIVTDTPDRRRVDLIDTTKFNYLIKIDHHPFIEKFCDIELIEEEASSVCEVIMKMLLETELKCNSLIARTLFVGLVSDSNRFLFNSCTPATFSLIGKFLDTYSFDMYETYQKLYARPLNESRLEGYIALNMVVTDNGLGYIKLTNDLLNQFGVDSAAAGNMVNNFNFINEVKVWATITEDIKNSQIRVSIRSRGPEINQLAEKYNGGGHKFASGVKFKSFDEAQNLMNDLDQMLIDYNIDMEDVENDN